MIYFVVTGPGRSVKRAGIPTHWAYRSVAIFMGGVDVARMT